MARSRKRYSRLSLSKRSPRAIALSLAMLALLTSLLWLKTELEAGLPEIPSLEPQRVGGVTKILSSDGQLVATLFRVNHKPLPLDRIGRNVVSALLSVEDHRFYQHFGVDWRGVARAAAANLRSGQIHEGASTLTMQLARHLYLDNQPRGWRRKAQEAILASRIEEVTSKSEILERYLNDMYFGGGAYGIGAAASRFFSKTPRELSVAQAALLVGLLQSPTFLNPVVNPEGARQRQSEVLARMHDLNNLTDAEYATAMAEARAMSLKHLPKQSGPMLKYPYFTTYVISELTREMGEENLARQPLTVRTTLDISSQRIAQQALNSVLATEGDRYGVHNGAVVVIENETGALRAMVGGREWSLKDQFNRAFQARRQAGSTFKPFVYTAALENGYQPFSDLWDAPLGTGAQALWRPINSDGRGLGQISLREALTRSRNQATARLMSQLGPDLVLEVCRRFGLHGELPAVPSLALGSGAVTPLEMASAYTVFANGGWLVESHPVMDAVSSSGKRMVDHRHPWISQALSPLVATQMTDILLAAVNEGTGANASLPGLAVAGKTGTTDAYRDAWFVGFTPSYTVAVWMGNDDNTSTNGLYGGELPAQVFRKVMSALDQPKTRFDLLNERPTTLSMCTRSHYLVGAGCSQSYIATTYLPSEQIPSCHSCPIRRPTRTTQFVLDNPEEAFPTTYTFEGF